MQAYNKPMTVSIAGKYALNMQKKLASAIHLKMPKKQLRKYLELNKPNRTGEIVGYTQYLYRPKEIQPESVTISYCLLNAQK